MTNNATPFFVPLPDRGLIHIEGADRYDFLQGLISNDIKTIKPDAVLYACLLTPQGKFLHDFFVYDGDGFLRIDCEGGDRAQDLFKRLSLFRLRSNVSLSLEPQNNNVYAIMGAKIGLPDPRHAAMGYRSFEKPDLEEQPFEVWDKQRIALTIPDGSRDMIVERSTLLECNLDTLNAINWDKGCYMGQELTARMHYRGLAKKHLYTVHNSIGGENLPESFTRLDNGIEMRSSCGDIGLALIKDEQADTLKDESGKILLPPSSQTLGK